MYLNSPFILMKQINACHLNHVLLLRKYSYILYVYLLYIEIFIFGTDSSNYDYAVPELSSAPLLTKRLDTLSDRATELVSDVEHLEQLGHLEHMDAMDCELNRSVNSIRSKHSNRVRVKQTCDLL